MSLADLVLDSSPNDFESFFFKATDQDTSLVVLVASKSLVGRLLEEVGDAPGLYVLQAEDTTVYVGQSKALQGRLQDHKSSNKIAYQRVMVVRRDQRLSNYLDYSEAKLYQTLQGLGYHLEQSSLLGSLEAKRVRLASIHKEHVVMADKLVSQFLAYSAAFGLTRPARAVPSVRPPVEVPLGGTAEPSSGIVPPPLPLAPPVGRPVHQLSPGKALPSSLVVCRRDGTQVPGKSGVAVLIAALTEAGLAEVAALALTLSGEELVSRTKSLKYPSASHPVGPWFVMSHSNTADKAKRLRLVSTALDLGWTVQEAPGAALY